MNALNAELRKSCTAEVSSSPFNSFIAALRVPEKYWKLARNGGKLPAGIGPELAENQRARVYAGDELLGIAHREADVIRFDVGLIGG